MTKENRTVLLIGEFGNAETDPPIRVSIVGDLHSDSEDLKPLNFKGLYTDVIPLDSGPALILAERVPREVWSKERRGTMCPDSSIQVIRVTWTGGVRLPNGDELGETERALYRIEFEGENDQSLSLEPDYLADLEDRDNNHFLCLDSELPAISVHSRQVTWWIQTEISILIHLSLYYEGHDGDPNSRTNLKGV